MSVLYAIGTTLSNTLEERTIQKIIQDEGFPNDTDATPKGDMPVPCN